MIQAYQNEILVVASKVKLQIFFLDDRNFQNSTSNWMITPYKPNTHYGNASYDRSRSVRLFQGYFCLYCPMFLYMLACLAPLMLLPIRTTFTYFLTSSAAFSATANLDLSSSVSSNPTLIRMRSDGIPNCAAHSNSW